MIGVEELQRELRRVAAQHRRMEQRRNELIVQARQEGMTLEGIGALVGLTHGGVRKIVLRTEQGASR